MDDPVYFKIIASWFSLPGIVLFASRLNKQLDKYVSWKPDPDSCFIVAMSISWSSLFTYMFPSVSMFWPVLAKLEKNRV